MKMKNYIIDYDLIDDDSDDDNDENCDDDDDIIMMTMMMSIMTCGGVRFCVWAFKFMQLGREIEEGEGPFEYHL